MLTKSSRIRRRKGNKRLRSLATFRLDFGAHCGKTIAEAPIDYTHWLAARSHDATARWIAQQYIALTGNGLALPNTQAKAGK